MKHQIDSVHERKNPFKCDICDNSCSQKSQLNLHIASVHEKSKPFKCKSCDTPLTPDRPQVKRSTPSLQITSNFLVFYGLSHGITLEKNGMAQNLIYSRI